MIFILFTTKIKIWHLGTRIGRLRVIFKLPEKIYGSWPSPSSWPSEPLAYIEWFDKLKKTAEPYHDLYLVTKPLLLADGNPPGAIIPLSSIRQSCHLLPDFSNGVPSNWTTDTVLDNCRRFYLNSFSSKYAYQTLW